ncbi:hypothetical protein HU200_051925 [Digitaria exilis]|uniref:Uncharacterized protein n=1 Tax=Digitaria exilis TaxID=1010633 RepID=A0A835ALQ7_9POAL|nr:hypothetical protein HU200_051925 [Digitaria exilis]
MTNTTIIPHDHQPRLQQEREQAPVILKPPPPQMIPTTTKKHARRRTHTSRPYQERLLNMAEARREIVTALKIHRANMREPPPPPLPPLRQCQSLMIQQLRRHEQHQQQQVQLVSQYHDQNQVVGEEEAPPAPTSSFAADRQLGDDPLAHWIAAGDASAGSHYYCSTSPFVPYDLTPLELEVPTSAMGGMEQLARSLPAQPLGLNLSFQGFGGSVSVDAAEDCDQDLFGGVPLIQSSSLSPAASSYYSPEATEMASGTQHASPALISTVEEYSPAPAAFMPMLDDGEMQSGSGEAQGEETAADVTAASAWWSKILLESMESCGEVAEGGAADGCTAEDEAAAAAISLPVEWRWLCDNDGVVDEQGAVVKGTAEPPDVMETMLTDGNYYTFCYSDEAGRRRGRDDINLPW